jgi:DNA-binding transcriptional MerR regulator
MTLAAERDSTINLFRRVERLEGIAEASNLDQDQRMELRCIAHEAVAQSGPIRPAIAAEILDLSEKTIRSWLLEGLLVATPDTAKRKLLDPGRVHQVLHIVRELRAAGQQRNLLDAIWYRLSDESLRDREDLTQSLEQMRRGEGRVVRVGERSDPPADSSATP